MPWIVDGDNLLGSRRDDESKRELARRIERFRVRTGRRVLLVFDGPPPPLGLPGEVEFSGPGRRADDRILQAVAGNSDRRGVTVVTDDRSLGDRCRALGARVARAGALRRELSRGATAVEKPDSRDDLAHWERIFREDRSGES